MSDDMSRAEVLQAALAALHEFVNAENAFVAGQIFDQRREILARPETKEIFTESLRRKAADERAVSMLESRWDMLDRFLAVGPSISLEGYPAIIDAVEQYVNIEPGRPGVIDTTPSAILSREANWVFADLLAQPRSEDEIVHLLSRWNGLRTLRSGQGLQFSPLAHTTVSASPAAQAASAQRPVQSQQADASNQIESLLQELKRTKGFGRTLLQAQIGKLYRSCSGDCGTSAAAAIPYLEEALTGLVGDYRADQRREVRIELSAAYLDATAGNRVENLQRAIAHLAVVEKELLESRLVGLDDQATDQLFRTYLNLGTAYKACADFGGKIIKDVKQWRGYLAQQIRAYRAARWLIATRMVAPRLVVILYCGLGNTHSTLGHRKRAVAYYLAALEAAESAGDSELAASLHHNLGDELAKMENEQPGATLLALEHLRRALAFYGAATYPADRLQSLRVLGRLLFDQHEWDNAEDILAEAVILTEAELSKIADGEARRREVEKNEDIFARSAFCLLRRGRIDEAVARLEQGKSRLARERFPRDKDGDESPSLLDAIPAEGAAVMFFATPAGGAALIAGAVTQSLSAENVVWFENEIETAFRALVFGADGWINSYFALAAKADPRWEEALDRLMRDLWSLLMQPIVERLCAIGVENGAEVLLFPHGWLSSLPLHCAFRTIDGRRRYATDDFAFRHVPSLHVLGQCRRRAAQNSRKGTALLAVVDPRSNLPGAILEGTKVVELFAHHGTKAPVVLMGNDASSENVLAALPSANYVLFSCHGQFHWGAPSASALCLAGGVNLRLSEIEEKAGALEQVRLVVLSACESGITSLQTPDEFIGFPVAFLLAGAPGVMASLWRVDDASTAFLISRFYEYLLSAGAPASPAQALRRAQLDLCDLPPEDLELFAFRAAGGMDSGQQPQRHLSAWDRGGAPPQGRPIRERPYLWGAFTLVGA